MGVPTEKNIKKAREAAKAKELGDIKKIDNKLIEAAVKKPNIQAMKIIFFLAHELAGQEIPDEGMLKVKVDLRKLTDYTGIAARDTERYLMHMQGTSIMWENEDGSVARWTSLVPRFERNFNNNTVGIDLFNDIAKMIIDVPRHIGGTILNVKDMSRLKSKHTIRMLPILHMINGYDDPKQKTYDLDELNAIFGVKKRSIYQMEKEIIEPLYNELNGSNKMSFDYEIKKGYESIKRRGRPKALGITITPKPRARLQATLL